MRRAIATMAGRPPTRRERLIFGLGLLGTAVLWPVLNLGPRRPTLLTVTGSHGVDLGDVLALVPFLCALIVLIPAVMPQRGKTSSLASKYFRAKSSMLILAVVAVVLVGIG